MKLTCKRQKEMKHWTLRARLEMANPALPGTSNEEARTSPEK